MFFLRKKLSSLRKSRRSLRRTLAVSRT
jgi:hypothetical protein